MEFQSDFSRGYDQDISDGKGASAPQKLSNFSIENVIKKHDFSSKNIKIYVKSKKMTPKGVQEPLIKSYDQIVNFVIPNFKKNGSFFAKH